MLRVSVTAVDQLLYYKHSEQMGVEELIERLTQRAEPTEAMLLGRAIHSVLERAGEGELDEVVAGGFRIRFDCDASISLPEQREVKLERTYNIDGERVTVVGKVDAIHGMTVTDHKVTSRFDAERLIDSMQWRAYLELTGCSRFVWNVFETSYLKREGVWKVYGCHQLTQYRYPGLATVWESELAEYVRFARRYLPAA